MEKIYENKNHNKNEKKQIKIDGTTILSFAVALFAIVSLVTVGFNQISYAIPDVELPIKDDFKVNGYADGANSGDRIIGTGAITNGDGTVTNTVFPVHPYFALEGATLAHQKWPNASTRNISLKCKQVMRGNTANQLAASESIHNTVPADGQEWCFIEFDIEYISSSNGMNDPVQANDIIYTDSLFTEKGNSLVVYEIATHGTNLSGYGVIDNQLYPGSSGTVIIGLLINSSTKDILLRVPYKSQNTNSWIKCN